MVIDRPLLDKSLIVLELEASDTTGVLKALASLLIREGYVKESYLDAVIAREEEFPTGLPTNGVGVAIPHADGQHVCTPGIAVATLRQPVEFGVMGNPRETVPVAVVFMLAIREPDSQVDMLRQLMGIFQDEGTLLQLRSVTSSDEILKILRVRLALGVPD